MIPISSRFAIPLMIAIALLLIPITYHEMNKPRSGWCENPEAALDDRVMPNVDTQELPPTPHRRLTGETSGTLELPGKWLTPPRFRITRTFELDHYYFAPRRSFITPYLDDTLETLVVDGISDSDPG